MRPGTSPRRLASRRLPVRAGHFGAVILAGSAPGPYNPVLIRTLVCPRRRWLVPCGTLFSAIAAFTQLSTRCSLPALPRTGG